jgi:sugar lactone lactonase YvrE
LRDDQICSNGKAIIDSGSECLKLIDIDSPTRKVVSYSLDITAGRLGDAEVVLDFAGDPAVPDGAILTPDNTGVIVAMFRPESADHGETRLYDLATGKLRCTWQTAGSPQNTCPALVRHDGLLKLVITTAAENMNAEVLAQCPNAGRLFLGESGDLDAQGPTASRFPM